MDRTRSALLSALLACLLPLGAQAAAPQQNDIEREIEEEMDDARKEVREELAAARLELETSNLDVGDGLHFGKPGKHKGKPAGAGDESLPKAEITPRGDFLVDGKAVPTSPQQRRELLAYRGQVIEIAQAGIDIGERSAMMALDMVDRGLFGLVFSAMTGSLERRMEKTIKEAIEPGVVQICQRLPALHASQQQLATSLPSFRPYATLEADDVEDCEDEIRREFAAN